jgi:hypothetical protein
VAPAALQPITPATTFPVETHWRPEGERIVLSPLPDAVDGGAADAGAPPDAGADAGVPPAADDGDDDAVDAGARCVHAAKVVCSADCWCRDLSGLAATDLVAVFSAGGETWAVGPTVLRRTGEVWSNLTQGLTPTGQPGMFVPSPAGPLRAAGAVFGVDGEVWFATGARLRHLAGGEWDTSNALGLHPNELTALWGASRRSLWAVGRGGTVLRFDGASWTQVDVNTTEWLTSVAGHDGDEVWAAGTSGTVLHLAGARWTPVSAGGAAQEWFTGVQAPSAGEAWLSSNSGHLYRATAAGLTAAPVEASGPLFGLWFSSPSDGWAVGFAGLVLHYDGKRWRSVESGTTTDLLAIHGDAQRIWAVGRAGTLLFHPR